MRTINKSAWQAAKAAGETTLTFSAWRTEQKALAEANGEQIVTVSTSDNTVTDTNAGAVLAAQLNEAAAGSTGTAIEGEVIEGAAVETLDASQVSVETVMNKIDDAIVVVEGAQAAAVVQTTVSKSKLAEAIFLAELAKQQETGVAMVRKDILKRFVAEAGCTDKGANTYYQNLREKHGLVAKKA